MGLQLSGSIQLEGNLLVTGSANSVFENVLVSGKLTAQEIETQLVSSSIIYSSGSNKFGDLVTDTQQFTGSVDVSGSLSVNNTPAILGTLSTGQVAFGTAANTVGGDSGLIWDNVNKRLGIGTNSPQFQFNIENSFQSVFSTNINAYVSFINKTKGIGGNAAFIAESNNATQIVSAIYTSNETGSFMGQNRANRAYFYANAAISLSLLTLNTSPLQFGTANQQRMCIFGSTGNVLIQNGGTFTDAGFRLDVNGTARVQGSINIGDGGVSLPQDIIYSSNRFLRFEGNGLNLINWFASGTSPTFKHRFGFNNNSLLEIRADSSLNIGLPGVNQFSLALKVNSTQNIIEGYRNAFGVDVKELRIKTGDPFVTTTQSFNSGNIVFQTGTGINGGLTGEIIFQIGSELTERMRITSTGNVGIGTTAPTSAKLEVVGAIPSLFTADSQANSATYGGSIFYRNHTGANQGNGIAFSLNNASNAQSEYAYIGGLIETNTADSQNGSIIFAPTISGTRTERLRITSEGNVFVGCTSVPGAGTSLTGVSLIPAGAITAQRNDATVGFFGRSNDGELFAFYRGATQVGNISVTSVATSYNTTSDYRLKEDLQEIKGLEKVQAIKVYDYKWKSDESRMAGVLAHELAEVLPYAVTGEKDAERMQGVDYSKIVPILIKSIQELKTEIDSLKNQIK